VEKRKKCALNLGENVKKVNFFIFKKTTVPVLAAAAGISAVVFVAHLAATAQVVITGKDFTAAAAVRRVAVHLGPATTSIGAVSIPEQALVGAADVRRTVVGDVAAASGAATHRGTDAAATAAVSRVVDRSSAAGTVIAVDAVTDAIVA